MSDGKTPEGTDAEKEEKPPKYHIDESWFERQSRSLQNMIDSRVPAAGLSGEKPTRKRGKAASKGTSMADLARVEGFVTPELPILEAVFRLMLIHQNKPLDVEQISQELAERGIGIMDARVVRPEALTRMLDHDFHYGLTRYQED